MHRVHLYNQCMARWQRHARWIFAVGFFAVLAAVALLMRQRTTQTVVAPPQRLDPEAVAEIHGGDVIQLNADRRDVRIEFANQATYADGRTKLAGFKATIDNRGGRSYVISGQEAFVGAERSSYDVRGGVSLNTSDGLVLTTEHATFTEAEGLLRGPGPVKFQRGNMSGSGVGFTYDRQQDSVWLLDQAVIRFAATPQKAAMDVSSATAGYSRLQRYARFDGNVRMTRDHQVITADASTIFMQAQIDEPDRIELRGQSHITGGGSMGTLQTMQARDINLDYGPDGRTLEKALLTGDASMQLGRQDGAAAQQLFAQYVDLSLAPDGSVTALSSHDAVRMELLALDQAPARTITSGTLNASGEAGKGLTTLTFDKMTELRETKPDGGVRVTKSRTLNATLAATSTIDAATFSGGFTLTDGALRAASSDSRYQMAKGVLAISSGKDGPMPRVEDGRVGIDAPSIEVTLSPRAMSASGGATTTLNAGRRQANERGTTLLKDTEAVTVKSETFNYAEEDGKSTFTGKVWLLQGATSIKSDAMTLDDRQGNLLASGHVVSVLPFGGKPADGTSTSTSIGRAEQFEFVDAKRRATFTKDAQLDGVQGNLRADQIDLVLAPKDNTLERLEAQGPTVRVLIEKREATGTRLTYLPDDEQYPSRGLAGALCRRLSRDDGPHVDLLPGVR